MKMKSVFSLAMLVFVSGCLPKSCSKEKAAPVLANDVIVTDAEVGKGDTAETGDQLKMHYTGWLYKCEQPDCKGEKFDSSFDRNTPFEFVLGVGQVIAGWDKGVVGMKVGGKRRLVIPAALGYGERGAGGVIPPNAPLMFDIELIAVEKAKKK